MALIHLYRHRLYACKSFGDAMEWISDMRYYLTSRTLRQNLGMVIPVWFPPQISQKEMTDILSITLADFQFYVDPENLVLVIDGQRGSYEAVKVVQSQMSNLSEKKADRRGLPSQPKPRQESFKVIFKERNEGKGGAILWGIEELLKKDQIKFIVTRDADGDHFINDVPNLYRIVNQIKEEQNTELVLLIGCRANVHRPLGFLRGELERIINQVIFEGLKFQQAQEGKVLNCQYFAAYEPVPDMQSGFKMYSHKAAQIIAEGFLKSHEQFPQLDMLRWGAEILPIVEIILAGGTIGEISRITYESQPVTTFQPEKILSAYGNKVIWAFLRLGLKVSQSEQLLNNAMLRSPLYKDAQGLELLMKYKDFVLESLSGITNEKYKKGKPIAVSRFL